jgi:uncharacterized protein (TIGR02147 family)
MSSAGRQVLSRLDKKDTLDNWAAWLGYKSPRSISMVLSGYRLPTPQLIEKFSSELKLDGSEHRCFELMVKLEKERRAGNDYQEILEEIKRINPGRVFEEELTKKKFSFVSNWYFLVLKQMVSMKWFKESPEYLSEVLRNKVSPSEISTALKTMLDLGVLKRNPGNGALENSHNVQTTTDVPDAAIRRHHRQMGHRAIDALVEQPVDKREFCTATMAMDPAKMGEAKKMIREFRNKFIENFSTKDGGDVVQMNIQFFSHTDQNVTGVK